MNPTTQIIDLLVRPERSSELSFDRAGTVAYRHPRLAQLGENIAPFDLRQQLFPVLDEETIVGGVITGRLVHDSTRLRTILEPVALYALRNDQLGAQLDEAIERRCQAYLSRFAHTNPLVAVTQQESAARLTSLQTLQNLLQQEHNAIAAAYATDYQGVPLDKQLVKPATVTTTSGRVVTKSLVTGVATVQTEAIFHVQDQNGTPQQQGSTQWWASVPATYVEGADHSNGAARYTPVAPNNPELAGLNVVEYDDPANTPLTQTARSQGEPYRHLPLENEMSYQRASAEVAELLIQQTGATLAASRMVENLASELRAANLLVRKLQLDFIQTYLLPPYQASVVGIYRDEGEWVAAGQPVASVNDPRSQLLVGRLKHRGLLTVGMKVQVSTADGFDAVPPTAMSVNGLLVSIRAHDPENNVWDIIAKLTGATVPAVIPINYHFPPDVSETTVVVTP